MIKKRPQPPCKDCTDRQPKCHSNFEGYKTYKQEMDKVHEQDQRDRELASCYFDREHRLHKWFRNGGK